MSEPTPAACPICKGAKHVPGPSGGWARCECVVRRVREIAYLAAGVPEVFLAGETASYAPAWGASIPDTPLVWLRGPVTGLRRGRAAAHFLRRAIDDKMTAATTSLRAGLDGRFDRDAGAEWRRTVEDSRALLIEMDCPAHSYLSDVAAELWAIRSGMRGRTLFVSSVDLAAMTGRYGPIVCAMFASNRVARVSTVAAPGGRVVL